MKDRYLPVIIAAAAAAIVGVGFFTLFEVYPKTVRKEASEEIISDPFATLKRWLASSEIPVRILEPGAGPAGDPFEGEERIVFAGAGALSLSHVLRLAEWLEEGGSLVLFFDERGKDNHVSQTLLSVLGIEKEESQGIPVPNGKEESVTDDVSVRFRPGAGDGPDIEAREEYATTLEKSFGRGSLVVTGFPFFLESEYIREEKNAAFAWRLSGGHTFAERGILFLKTPRGTDGGLAARIARGTWQPAAVSGLLLFAAFIWSRLSVFGAARSDRPGPGLGIRERFAAEARFLQKYGVSNIYLKAYSEVLASRLRRKGLLSEGGGGPSPEYLARLTGIRGKSIAAALRTAVSPKTRRAEFVEAVRTFETILERI